MRLFIPLNSLVSVSLDNFYFLATKLDAKKFVASKILKSSWFASNDFLELGQIRQGSIL